MFSPSAQRLAEGPLDLGVPSRVDGEHPPSMEIGVTRGQNHLSPGVPHLMREVGEDDGRQVRSLLDHPQLGDQATLLMGDMNAWRRCRAMRTLDDELRGRHKPEWPASFPSARPVLALDRIYSRGARVVELSAHKSRAARHASDHLPIVARVRI